jgi:hypothetical protein
VFVLSFFTKVAALFADAFAVFLDAASFSSLCDKLVFAIQTSLCSPLVFGHSLASGLASVLAFRDLVAYSKLIRPNKAIPKDAVLVLGLVACLRFGALPSPVVTALEPGFDQAVLSAALETAEATLAANRTKQWSTLVALLVGSRQRCIKVWTQQLTSIAPVLARLPKVAQLTTAPPVSPSVAPAASPWWPCSLALASAASRCGPSSSPALRRCSRACPRWRSSPQRRLCCASGLAR